MSTKSKGQKAQELLSIQNNAGGKPPRKDNFSDVDNDNEDSKFINNPVYNTPFRVIGNERDGFILTLGKYRMIPPQETAEKAEGMLETNAWEIMFTMIASMFEMNEDILAEMRKSTLGEVKTDN